MRVLHSRSLVWLTLLALAALLLSGCGGSSAPAAAPKPAAAPAAAPAAPAAAPAPAVPLLIVDSVVKGSSNVAKEESAAKVCVLQSRYLHNEDVVWRIKVIDPATGKSMGDKDLAKVVVQLPDGQSFTSKFGPHPKDKATDDFWTTSWIIPENYPSGIVNYTILAEAKDGRKGTFVNFNVNISSLTVLDGAVPKIAK